MSYRKPNTGNTINDYFSRVRDFTRLAPKLLKVDNPQSFEIWLDKLIQIDKRPLVLYLRKYKDQIPSEHWKQADARLSRWLRDGA